MTPSFSNMGYSDLIRFAARILSEKKKCQKLNQSQFYNYKKSLQYDPLTAKLLAKFPAYGTRFQKIVDESEAFWSKYQFGLPLDVHDSSFKTRREEARSWLQKKYPVGTGSLSERQNEAIKILEEISYYAAQKQYEPTLLFHEKQRQIEIAWEKGKRHNNHDIQNFLKKGDDITTIVTKLQTYINQLKNDFSKQSISINELISLRQWAQDTSESEFFLRIGVLIEVIDEGRTAYLMADKGYSCALGLEDRILDKAFFAMQAQLRPQDSLLDKLVDELTLPFIECNPETGATQPSGLLYDIYLKAAGLCVQRKTTRELVLKHSLLSEEVSQLKNSYVDKRARDLETDFLRYSTEESLAKKKILKRKIARYLDFVSDKADLSIEDLKRILTQEFDDKIQNSLQNGQILPDFFEANDLFEYKNSENLVLCDASSLSPSNEPRLSDITIAENMAAEIGFGIEHVEIILNIFACDTKIEWPYLPGLKVLHEYALQGVVSLNSSFLGLSYPWSYDKALRLYESYLSIYANLLRNQQIVIGLLPSALKNNSLIIEGIEKALKRGHYCCTMSLLAQLLQQGRLIIHTQDRKDQILHHAVQAGHFYLAKEALKIGADSRSQRKSATRPLIITAVLSRFKECAHLLMMALEGAAHEISYKGKPLLLYVLEAGFDDLAAELINQGASLERFDSYRTTPLMAAVSSGSLAATELILKLAPGSINSIDKYGTSALHFACQLGSQNLVNMLIQAGASLALPESEASNCLVRAVESGNRCLVQFFIETKIFEINETNLMGFSALTHAVCLGRLDLVQDLLAAGAYWGGEDIFERSLVYLAAEKGHDRVLDYLLSTYPFDLNKTSVEQLTPLMVASLKGLVSTVDILLKYGGILSSRADQPNPLDLAIEHGHTHLVRYFLTSSYCCDWVKTFIAKQSGKNILLLAINAGHTEIIRDLIASGADLNARDQSGLTCLMLALDKKQENIAEILLSSEGINIHLKGKAEETALHYAIAAGFIEISMTLLRLGLDPHDKNAQGQNAFMIAASLGEEARLLIDFIFEIKINNIDEQCVLGNTILHRAASHSSGIFLIEKLVYEKNASLEIKNADNNTALDLAIINSKFECIKKLLEEGACYHPVMNHRTKNFQDSLVESINNCSFQDVFMDIQYHDVAVDSSHILAAVLTRQPAVVQLLLSMGCPLPDLSSNGESVLFLAARAGDLKTVKILLNHYPEMSIQRNSSLHRASDVAVQCGYQDCYEYLEKANMEYLMGPPHAQILFNENSPRLVLSAAKKNTP